MATLEDVKLWGIERGIGHIIKDTSGDWVQTLCDISTPSFKITKDLPVRKCRECMQNLTTAKVHQKGKQ